jgi:hypothetical protein
MRARSRKSLAILLSLSTLFLLTGLKMPENDNKFKRYLQLRGRVERKETSETTKCYVYNIRMGNSTLE